jgi:hypothetical protein
VKIQILITVITAGVLAFGCWVGGMDFSKRGWELGTAYFSILILSVLVGLALWLEAKEGGGK